MRDAIDKAISRDAAGLDDMMLKKMLLAYNTGKYSRKADIIIELGSKNGDNVDCNGDGRISSDERNYSDYNGDGQITEEEIETFKANKKLIEECEKDSSLYSPFKMVQGKDLEQLNINIFDNIGSHLDQFFETDDEKEAAIKAERKEKQEKQNKYYLHANGVLIFLNDKNEELVYYNEGALKKLYDEYEDEKDWENRDYAESIWNYISSKAYTDGEKGIKMYGLETINEEVIDWTFNDSDGFTQEINRQLISEFSKERTIQDLDYYSLVAKYTTPVEFMIDLLNISSSQEFVNAFIDKVTNQTRVTLKVYKTRLSLGTEITEDIEETTIVEGEAQVSAKVVAFEKDKDGNIIYEEGDAGISVEVTLESDEILWGVGVTNVKMTLRNVPSGIRAVKLEVKIAERENPEAPVEIVYVGKDIENGKTKEITYMFPRYKTKSNTGTINRVTTQLSTTTKLDIAVEKADTWYGIITYNNYVQDYTIFESINSDGTRVEVGSADPIMVSEPKEDKVYTESDANFDAITDTYFKSVDSITVSEIWGKVEGWYANLTSDNLFYWGLGGPLTHNMYEWLGAGVESLYGTEDELLNIRFIYAMEQGIGDAFTKSTYTPIQMTCRSDSYEVGYLYTTINNQLIQDTTPTVEDNYKFFLSLLKNNTGKYDKDEDYNPNGKEVEYKTVYDSVDRVGRFFETSAEMLFSLLDSSLYTEGLISVMKYILYEYTTRNYGVSEFNYDIIPKAEFEMI